MCGLPAAPMGTTSTTSPQTERKHSRPRAILGDVTKHNVNLLRLLNSRVFPVAYHDQFYTDVLAMGEFAKLAWFQDCMVGAVCCRFEKQTDGSKWVYIMTLGCLDPYRLLGIGTVMLQHIMAEAQKDLKISRIYLHVQTSNEAALAFYRHFGFEVTGMVENYYKLIDPSNAYILAKALHTDGDEAKGDHGAA